MSLPYILFELSLFSPGDNPVESRRDLGWLLEALVQRNQAYLKDHPDTPLLYQSGVVYERPAQFLGGTPEVQVLKEALGPKQYETKVAAVLGIMQQILGGERFRDIGVLYARGKGDCDNVASARVAELRQAGIKASPLLTWRRRLDGGYTYHVLVKWPDNFNINDGPDSLREDPSLLLGMGGEGKRLERERELEKNRKRVAMVLRATGKKDLVLPPEWGMGPKAPAAQASFDGSDPFSELDGGML